MYRWSRVYTPPSLINELILVSRADSASKKLPHLDNLFYQPQLKQEFEQDSSAEENVNSKTNEQARKSKQPIKQQSGDWTKNKETMNEQRKHKLEMIDHVIKWQVVKILCEGWKREGHCMMNDEVLSCFWYTSYPKLCCRSDNLWSNIRFLFTINSVITLLSSAPVRHDVSMILLWIIG